MNRPSVRRFLAAALIAAFGFASAPAGATIARTLKLTREDIADLVRIEAHLNSAKTVRSRFLQVSSDGSYAEGMVHIQRPGRMRLEYDPPNPTMVVADGINLIHVDRELDQAVATLLFLTPAQFILREDISFTGDEILVTGFSRAPGVIRVSVVKAKDPDEGRIMLVFSDKPLELRKWVVTDAQGVKTTVSLLGPEFGMKLDPALFRYQMPNLLEGN
ncbi:MAG: outer membrane lipoprotein carrier protein LolA [Rhodospirillaceae bacterium]